MGVTSCPSGGQGQTAVPVFGWASQGLKGTSTAQGHRTQETHTGTFVPAIALGKAVFVPVLGNAAASSPPLESQGPLDQGTRGAGPTAIPA